MSYEVVHFIDPCVEIFGTIMGYLALILSVPKTEHAPEVTISHRELDPLLEDEFSGFNYNDFKNPART